MISHSSAPTKALIRQTALCNWLDLSRSGLDKLRKKDPTFPRPIKDGNARQAAAFYVVAEVEAWLRIKIEARDISAPGRVA
ncbi:helix-turn-helix transcriptional regulator [Pseudomonas luteola]